MSSAKFNAQKEIMKILQAYMDLAIRTNNLEKKKEIEEELLFFGRKELPKKEAEEKLAELLGLDISLLNKLREDVLNSKSKDFTSMDKELEDLVEPSGLHYEDVRRASWCIGKAKFYGASEKNKRDWLSAYTDEIKKHIFRENKERKLTNKEIDARELLFITIYAKVVNALEEGL
jgi:ribosomal protein S24E